MSKGRKVYEAGKQEDSIFVVARRGDEPDLVRRYFTDRRRVFERVVSIFIIERTPLAHAYFWAGSAAESLESHLLLALFGNALLYFGLSYGLLSLFGGDKINIRKMLSVSVAFLTNPILILILDKTDRHVHEKWLFTLRLQDRTLHAYMFNWSSFLLPFQISLRSEILLALICNSILYFLLIYWYFNLFFESKDLEADFS